MEDPLLYFSALANGQKENPGASLVTLRGFFYYN